MGFIRLIFASVFTEIYVRKLSKEFIQNKLCDSTPSIKDKIQSILYIAFRLRNNLYHGEKDVSTLYDQNENFKQINLFLMEVIDKKS